jgi:hypothetical protein
MNILVVHRVGAAFGYITDGWINALRDKGHNVRRWDGLEQSWYDFKPDLYIGCSGHKQPIPSKRNTKVAIHVNPYGPVNVMANDGRINESDAAIRWTVNQKPDVVFGYGDDEDKLLWSYWETKYGIRWVPMPVAGDKTQYRTRSDQPKYDIVYLGGRWAYKGLTIDEYLLPLFKKCPEEGVTYKIFGWGDWPPDLGVKVLAEDQSASFLASGKIGPCISEKHTHDFGIDIPERAFKLALCGVLVVHDTVPAIRRYIPHALIGQGAEHFQKLCLSYARPEADSERKEIASKQRNYVLKHHTYHNRMATLLSSIGFKSEAESMLI